MYKIKNLLITTLLVMVGIMFTVKASAEEFPQLKLKYNDFVDEKHACLEVELTDFPKVAAFSISIAYDKNNVNVCAYDEETNTFSPITNKVLDKEEYFFNNYGYAPGNITDDSGKWDGDILTNDVYPFIRNDDGLLSIMFMRVRGEHEITGTQTAFKVYFEKLNDNAPQIRLARADNTVIIDYANSNGATFAGFDGEIPYTVVYEGLEEPVGILDNSSGESSNNGTITENIPSLPQNPGNEGSSAPSQKEDKEDIKDTENKEEKPVVEDDKKPEADEQEPTSEVFSDLGDALWAKDAIEYLSANKIINGYGNGIFAPNKNITREELVKIIVTAKKLPISENESVFTDSVKGKWYVPYLATAYENNIVMGYPDGRFGVGENITRQDLAVMLYRAFYGEGENSGYEDVSYNDSDSIANYAKEAVHFLTKEKIFSGRGDNLFNPNDNATRAEAAKVIYMLCRR